MVALRGGDVTGHIVLTGAVWHGQYTSSVWQEFKQSLPLIVKRSGWVRLAFWNTIRIALYPTVAAMVLGMPLALALGIGRFRGRRLLQALANASLALPSVVVGVVFVAVTSSLANSTAPAPGSVTAWIESWYGRQQLYIAMTVLALPYILALVPAAIRELPPELLAQARLLRAGRVQLSLLVLREARIGVLAAVMAALGAGLSDVGAVTIIGGCTGNELTLGCMIVPAIKDGGFDGYPGAIAAGLVLLGLVLLLLGSLTIMQQRRRGRRRRVRMRFATAPAVATTGL